MRKLLPLNTLYTPSLQQFTPEANEARGRPYSGDKLALVGAVTGIVPCTLLALLNARRLTVPDRQMKNIVLTGVFGTVVIFTLSFLLGWGTIEGSEEAYQTMLVLFRFISIIISYIFYRMNLPYARAYYARTHNYNFGQLVVDNQLWKAIATVIPQELTIYGIMLLAHRIAQ